MKTKFTFFGIAIIWMLSFTIESKAQTYSYKALYVYSIDSILNDATGKTEDVLLRYCRDSSFNALIISPGVLNLNTSSSYTTKLAAFIKKAKTRYGLKYFTAVVSDYTTLLSEVHPYQASRTDSLEKFSFYNYEFEYWNDASYLSGGSYCSNFLSPSYTCDSVGAWSYFTKNMKKVDSLAAVDNIKSSLYIGVSSKDPVKNQWIANNVDLIMIACYNADTSKLYMSHTTGKFTNFASTGHMVTVIPIFASLTKSAAENLRLWLKVPPTGKHAESSAMPIFMREYALLSSTVKSKINIPGYAWFKYGGMPKDSSFTQITVIPSGLSATANSNAAFLSWNAVPGANQYVVWYALQNNYNWTAVTSSTNSLNIAGLTTDKTYQYMVFAKTTSGNTASSMPSFFLTSSVANTCGKVASASTTSINSSGASLSWLPVQGALSYNLRYKIATAAAWTNTSSVASNYTLASLSPSSNYEFQLQTNCSGAISSDFTSSFTFSTTAAPCIIPTTLASNAITSSGAILSWSSIPGAASYLVNYRISSIAAWTSMPSNTNSINLSGLTAASNYEFQVQSVCSSINSSSFSTISTFTTSNPVCNVPGGLTTSNITTNSANTSWTAVANASNYIVNYRIKGTSIWTSTNTSASNTILSGLMPSSIYEFAIQTYCSASNTSAISATAEFTTIADCPATSSVSAIVNSASAAIVNWSSSNNAISYNLEYKKSTATTWNPINTINLSQSLSGLSASTTYQYRLQSVCSTINSVYSATNQFTTSAAVSACNTPTGISANSITSTSAKIVWTTVSGVSGYRVQYRISGSTLWTNKTTSNLYKSITSLKAGTTYEYQVQSICNSTLSSAFSASQFFNTTGSTTKSTANTYALRTSSGVTITWKSADEDNIAFYILEKSEDGIEYEPFKTISLEEKNYLNGDYEVNDGDYNLHESSHSVWYKLSSVDEDGQMFFHRIVEVLPKSDFGDEFKIYPNPNPGDQINIDVKLERKEEILVVLLDILGNTVYSKVIVTDDNGHIATAINPSQELAKGIYQVVGYASKKSLSQKLIVK